VYETHFPTPLGDVRHVSGVRWKGSVDLIVGGSPCQNLSSFVGAGQHAGDKRELEGAKSSLFFEYVRVMRECDAKHLRYVSKFFCSVNVMYMMSNSVTLYRKLLKIAVETTFPPNRRGRPLKATFDETFECIAEVVRTGVPWRSLKCNHVASITVFKTMHKWANANLFEIAYQRLLKLYARRRRPRHYAIDSTFVKNIYGRDVVGRNPTDRGRKATKFSVVVDDLGVPHAFLYTGANVSDMVLFERTLDTSLVQLHPKTPMYADKGYDSRRNKETCTTKFGLADRLFRRRTTNTRRTHAKRGVVERFFAWQDKQRRLLVRYEQQVHVYASMVYIFAGALLSKVCIRVFGPQSPTFDPADMP
jgi:putative transposase